MLNLLSKVRRSFYSQRAYQDVRDGHFSDSVKYLAALLCVIWIPGLIQFHGQLVANVQRFKTEILPQLPIITYDRGKISTQERRAYLIRLGGPSGRIAAIIDMSGQYTALSGTTAFLLLTPDSALIHIPGTDPVPMNLKSRWLKSKVIDATFLLRLRRSTTTWIFAALCTGLLFFSFLKWMAHAGLIALIGMTINSALELDFTFPELMRLCILASTPLMICVTAVSMFHVHSPLLTIFRSLLMACYFIFALIAAKPRRIGRCAAWWNAPQSVVLAIPLTLIAASIPIYLTLFGIGFPRWGSLNVQARYAFSLRVMDAVSRGLGKLLFPWIVPIGFILLLAWGGLVLVYYVTRATDWRSPRAALTFLLSQTTLGALGFFLMKSLLPRCIELYSALGSVYGEESWICFILPAALSTICLFLIASTWAAWGYVPGGRRPSRWRGGVMLGTIAFYGSLRIFFFLYGDTGRSFVKTIGLDEKNIPQRSVLFIGDSSTLTQPLRIRLMAECPCGILGKRQPQVYPASTENLRRIENWLRQHPKALCSGIAYEALVTGSLAQWNVETAYQWLHRHPQFIMERMFDVAVLNTGPLKPERKAALADWTDGSKWILGPVSQAKLAGQWERYGDREKAEALRHAVACIKQ